jgi:hypothetical protein
MIDSAGVLKIPGQMQTAGALRQLNLNSEIE